MVERLLSGSARRLIRRTRLLYAKWLFDIAQELRQYSVRDHGNFSVRNGSIASVGLSLAGRLHPRLRTCRCEAANQRFGPGADMIHLPRVVCRVTMKPTPMGA